MSQMVKDSDPSISQICPLVKTAPTFGSGAGDIALVFNFIKALDPDSVVNSANSSGRTAR